MTAFLDRLKPAEGVTVLFLLFLIVLSLLFGSGHADTPFLLLIYLILLLAQLLLSQRREVFAASRTLNTFRGVVFPVICVFGIFDSLSLLIPMVNPRDIDNVLIKIDYLLFRGYPTVLLETLAHPALTDFLQVGYTTYYFLPVSLGCVLLFRGRHEDFEKALFLILLCFYLSYVGYLLFPALGPRFTINHLHTADLRGLFMTDHIQDLLNRLEGIKRDAFPSGHTAIALVVAALAYRSAKDLFTIMLPMVILIIIATVYCRYHYFVDIIGGAALAGITLFLGERWYEYWKDRNNSDC